ncbi:class I SAM-dependent methyltransferase [Aureivirga sp. CE67]|uniref:class I SAM-dependent methyltransferase n=1 Tax=Aureivirga sp. CE67 TaxID=1788983 RepID=UPI0018C9C39E|nr:rRNA adenine N-6-methyltransferase family protein [Aureivirga sp. CE67]
MNSFFKEALKSLKTSGTIKPSSKYLINNCLKDLPFDKAKTIIEFGAGDGCFTREISKRMRKDTMLYSFEINKKFYEYSCSQFENQNNIKILNNSALDFDEILSEKTIYNADIIISSLPLSLLNNIEVSRLLNKINKYLKSGGVFVQYQYSLGKFYQFKDVFYYVNMSLTLINIPPAFVFKCYKY